MGRPVTAGHAIAALIVVFAGLGARVVLGSFRQCADKYDAEVDALQFAKQSSIAVNDVGKAAAAITAAVSRHRPPHLDKALDHLPIDIRTLLRP